MEEKEKQEDVGTLKMWNWSLEGSEEQPGVSSL